MHPLCRHHHNLKTHGRIVLEPSTDPADPPGSWHWRLPTGRTYTATPDPAITPLPVPDPDTDHEPPGNSNTLTEQCTYRPPPPF
jgi:hypothetical protein